MSKAGHFSRGRSLNRLLLGITLPGVGGGSNGALLGYVPPFSAVPSTQALLVSQPPAPVTAASSASLGITNTQRKAHYSAVDLTSGGFSYFWLGLNSDGSIGCRLQLGAGGTTITQHIVGSGGSLTLNNFVNGTGIGAGSLVGQRVTATLLSTGDIVLTKTDGTTVFTIPRETTESYVNPDTWGTYANFTSDSARPNPAVGPVSTLLSVSDYSFDLTGRPTAPISYNQVDAVAPAYEIQMLKLADDSIAFGWTDAIVVANPVVGTATITHPQQLTAAQRAISYKMQHRRKGTTDAPVTVPWRPAPALQSGLNRGGFNGFTSYNRTYQDADMGWMSIMQSSARVAIRAPFVPDSGLNGTISGRALGMDNTGRIFNYPPGDTAILFNLPTQIDAGAWTINLPTGMSASMTVANGISISGNTLTSSGPQVGIPEMRVTGTIPPEGFRLSITRNGETATSSAQSLVEHQQWKVKWYRYMDASRVNNTYDIFPTLNDEWDGYITMGPISARRILAESLNLGTHPWINNDRGFCDAIVTHRANVILAGLLSTTRHVAFEVDNEIWNDAFGKSGIYAFEGLKKGYRGAAGGVIGTQVAAMPSLQDRTSDFNAGGTPKAAFAQGDIVYTQNVVPTNQFRGIWQANRAITANNSADALGSNTNAAWTVLATAADAIVAKALAYSDECDRQFALIKAEAIRIGFPLERLHFVLNSQTGVGSNRSTKNTILWNSLGTKYNLVDARAPYFGTGFASTSLNANGWTATERALVNTDLPAFKTAFYAYIRQTMKKEVDTMAKSSAELDAWCTANSIPLLDHWCYEAGQHYIGSNSGTYNGATTNAQLNAIYFDDMYRSQTFGDIYAEYQAYWAAKVGGVMCLFQQGSFKPGSAPPTNWLMSDSAFELLPVGLSVAQYTS